MKRTTQLALAFTLLASLPIAASAASIVYETGTSNPWGNTTNDAAMDTAFGTGAWSKYNGFSMAGFGADTQFVYLDGSAGGANQLSSFLASNINTIQNFVSNGGHLFINAAPGVGSSFSMGFGGITLNYANYSNTASATAAGIATGIFNGLATNYTGGAYSHATVSGPGLTSLMDGAAGSVFADMAYGNGLVAFGGMTTVNFHYPAANAAQLRANMLQYVASGASPVPVPAAAWLLGSGLLGLIGVARRKAA